MAVRRLDRGERPPLVLIVGVALAARLVLLPSNLIQENDPYRYVLDGQITLHGGNPYLVSPKDLKERGLDPALAGVGAERTLNRIGYPEIPTVYPPAAQLAFAAGAWLSGWDWRGQRWIFLIIDLFALGLLSRMLHRLGAASGRLLIYAWNPLVLKEVANSAHLDVLVAAFLTAAVLAGWSDRAGRRPWRAAVSGTAFGLAVMSKLYPVILFPAFFFHFRRREGWATAGVFAIASAAAAALLWMPFSSGGLAPAMEGLRIYAREWRMNEGAFSLLAWLTPNPRLAVGLTVAALATLMPALGRDSTIAGLIGQIQWILLIWFLLIPSPFPWYALPLAALATLSPATATARATLALSGAMALYYFTFLIEYRDLDPVWWTVTQALEHTLIWAVLLRFAFRDFAFDRPWRFLGR